MSGRSLLRLIRWKGLIVAAYILLGTAGVFALQAPSASLKQQGGYLIVAIWSACCIVGMLLGLLGFFTTKTVLEIIGIGLLTSASLTWAGAIVLQAKSSANGVAPTVTAISVALTVTALLVQRGLDVARSPNR